MSNCSGNMMSTSEFDETGKVCSIWTKCDCNKFLTQKVCFDTMALLAWWSAPEAKLTTKFNKKYIQSHFVHMLQTLPVSSNSEVLIMFPEQFDMDSWIIEVSTFYRRKKLRSLEKLHHHLEAQKSTSWDFLAFLSDYRIVDSRCWFHKNGQIYWQFDW